MAGLETEIFCDVAGISGHSKNWTDLDRFGPIWTDLDQFGPIWTWDRVIWTNLDRRLGESETHQQHQLASAKKGTNKANIASIDAD